MERLSKREQWEEMVEFYQDLIERSGWPIECMRELVVNILDCDISEKYYPSSSHASLGISMEFEYKYRLKKPMVYILCDENVENFKVNYQHGQGNTRHTKIYPIEKAKKMLRSVDGWLQNA